jgi:hypothetical protein
MLLRICYYLKLTIITLSLLITYTLAELPLNKRGLNSLITILTRLLKGYKYNLT